MSEPRRAPVLAVLLLLAGLATPLPAAAQSASEQIHALIAADKLDEALRVTNKNLAQDKDNINLQFLKGLILTKLNHLDQARDIFERLTKEHPELPEPYNNLAVIYAAQGDFTRAQKALQEAINTHPSYATAHENMGDIYARLASQAYSQALQLDKDNTTAKAKLSLINDLFSVPKPAPAAVAQAPQPAAAGAADTEMQARAESGSPAAEKEQAAAAPVKQPAGAEPAATAAKAQQQPASPAAGESRGEAVAQVRDAVSAWSKAWSSQDVDAYLSHYDKAFTPPESQSLQDWKRERKDRLTAPRFIRLTVSDLDIKMLGPDYAQATFTQEYQSDTYSDRVTKLLLFTREGKDWRIVQEATK